MTTNHPTNRNLKASAFAAVAAAGVASMLPAAVGAHSLIQRAPSGSASQRLAVSRARAPLALPPAVIARLRPGRSIYSNHHSFGPDWAYTHAKVVFGSDFGGNEVDVFKQVAGFAYVATLSDQPQHACNNTPLQGPQGMWVDHNRSLWVADTYNTDVRMFPLGQTTSTMTLSDPGYYPVGVTVDDAGNVYATNLVSTSGGFGNVAVWAPPFVCNAAPTFYLNDATFGQVYFASSDGPTNDVYVDYIDTGGTPRVCYIAAPNIVPPNVNICSATVGDFVSRVALGFPGSMQVLPLPPALAKIGIDDQIGPPAGIGIYKLPLPPAPGAPYLPCTTYNPPFNAGLSVGPFGDPVTFAFTNAKGYELWASDAFTSAPGGELLRATDKVCPGAAGTFTGVISGFNQLIGTAVSPSVSP
jgi:hypothetical protein